MSKKILSKRLLLLSEIDRLQQGCDGCVKRIYFNNLKDATGLSHACKACPLGQEISKYGEKLLPLVSPRKKVIIKD